jgi:transcriptional regulator with XRE-family HTH domain
MADRGRPTEYDEKLTPKLAEALAKQGLTNEELAEELGISVRTLYQWKQVYPDFSHAVTAGGDPINQRVKNALLRRALGYDLRLKKEVVVQGELQEATYDVHIEPDVGAALQWLKNRVPDEWRDKQPETQSETGGLRIVLENKTDDPLFMSNVEINIPEVKKNGDESK